MNGWTRVPVPCNTPERAFAMATFATSATLSVVLRPKRVGRDIRKIKRKRNKVVGAFLLLTIPALIIPGLPFFTLLFALGFYQSYKRDIKDAEFEARWFGSR